MCIYTHTHLYIYNRLVQNLYLFKYVEYVHSSLHNRPSSHSIMMYLCVACFCDANIIQILLLLHSD